MTVKELEAKLFELFPEELAAEYDNVGLLVGNNNSEVQSIVVALDCTKGAIEFAKKIGANLIVTHHPVIFQGIKTATDSDIVFKLIKSGISSIAMHTNFDSANGGVCDALANALGITNVAPIVTSEGVTIRKGELEFPLSADDFANIIKQKLGGNVKYADAGKLIKTVALCSGSGSDFLYDAMSCQVDAYVSGEIKHHLYFDALNNNISVFDCGHYESEVVAMNVLKNAVESVFNGKVETYCHNEIKTI